MILDIVFLIMEDILISLDISIKINIINLILKSGNLLGILIIVL